MRVFVCNARNSSNRFCVSQTPELLHYIGGMTPLSLALTCSAHNLQPSIFTTSLPPSVSSDMNPATHLQATGTGTGHRSSFNVTNSYNSNYNTTYVDECPQILAWLSPLEPHLRHQDVRTRRLDGLGDWFLQKDGFINWSDGENGSSTGSLFCSGAPGAGKTYLR